MENNILFTVWFFCHVSHLLCCHVSSHDLSRPLLILFGMEICIIPQFSECFQVKKRFSKFSKRALLQATDAFVISSSCRASRALVFLVWLLGNSIVSTLFQYIISISIMVDIFPFAAFFLLVFAACVFSLFIFYSQPNQQSLCLQKFIQKLFNSSKCFVEIIVVYFLVPIFS